MKEIIVGLDTSTSAQTALAWAATQARLTGAPLRAVHALALPATRSISESGVMQTIVPSDEVELRAIFDAVDPEPGWELKFRANDPGPVLVAESHRSAMLVIGTREHTGLGRLVSGSVSHYCLSHAHCPVVAVPARRSEDLAPTAGRPQRGRSSAQA